MPRYKEITGDTTVYSAAAWWRECDPSMQVIALSSAVAQKKIHALMKVEATSARDDGSFRSVQQALGDIKWTGPDHAFKLKDLVSARELPNAIRDLENAGYYYPEMP
ncbi:MAG: hypothetical protein Q7R30_23875 [Acidobacteriota bacterium]|nr:hypothetical protein [Acidobacteriota bacterium]